MKTHLGRYKIIREIGRGGMGTVYEAEDERLGRRVAIKELPPSILGKHPQLLARFNQEARLIARLKHKNILPIYDVGEDDGHAFFVMPLMKNGTLGDRIRQQGVLPPNEVVQIMQQLGSALDDAHAKGIIHRDIKPDNVLIDDDGNLLLTDFGIARLVEQTNSATSIGTPPYMAPEQWTGGTIDKQTDVYQLGVMLFLMLTGKLPYVATSPASAMDQHRFAPIPSVRQANAQLPLQIEPIIQRALAKQQDMRFVSASGLSTAIKEVLNRTQTAPPTNIITETLPEPQPIIARQKPQDTPWVMPLGAVWLGIGVVGLIIFGYILNNVLGTSLTEPSNTATYTPVPPTPTPTLGVGSTRKVLGVDETMVQVYVPAGEFTMGSENGLDELPVHTVFVDSFWLDQTEVTNAQYAEFLNEAVGADYQTACYDSQCVDLKTDDEDSHIVWDGTQYLVDNGFEQHPMIEVSWYGAAAFCEWREARLPTEAEWEKAAGWDAATQTQRTYPWGDEAATCQLANYGACSNATQTTEVGSFPEGASYYGAFDMAGNVWEWTQSQYQAYPYADDSRNDYTDDNAHRVLRGGSWNDLGSNVRAANRSRYRPVVRNFDVGFRCASTP